MQDLYKKDFDFILTEEIDGPAFHRLTKDDLKEKGLKLGEVYKIVCLQQSNKPAQPARNPTNRSFRQNFSDCFGERPQPKDIVASAKSLSERVIINKLLNQRKQDIKNQQPGRKDAIVDIEDGKVGAKGAILYLVYRNNGKRKWHSYSELSKNLEVMGLVEKWHAKNPDFPRPHAEPAPNTTTQSTPHPTPQPTPHPTPQAHQGSSMPSGYPPSPGLPASVPPYQYHPYSPTPNSPYSPVPISPSPSPASFPRSDFGTPSQRSFTFHNYTLPTYGPTY